jgi:hypothetical protein
LKAAISQKRIDWLEANKTGRAEIADPIEQELEALEQQALGLNKTAFRIWKGRTYLQQPGKKAKRQKEVIKVLSVKADTWPVALLHEEAQRNVVYCACMTPFFSVLSSDFDSQLLWRSVRAGSLCRLPPMVRIR